MILTDDENAKKWFKFARYNGRNERQDHKDIKDLDFLGWNMYMPPEQAAHGLKLFFDIDDFNEDSGGSHTYEDISNYTIFKKFMNKESKIFVAGHNGMVGKARVKALKQNGYTNILVEETKTSIYAISKKFKIILKLKNLIMFFMQQEK